MSWSSYSPFPLGAVSWNEGQLLGSSLYTKPGKRSSVCVFFLLPQLMYAFQLHANVGVKSKWVIIVTRAHFIISSLGSLCLFSWGILWILLNAWLWLLAPLETCLFGWCWEITLEASQYNYEEKKRKRITMKQLILWFWLKRKQIGYLKKL